MKRTTLVGLSLIAALLLTALAGATTASAAQIRAEEYPTSTSGTQATTWTFDTPGFSKLTCSTLTTSGSISSPKTTLGRTIDKISGCKYGGLGIAMSTNGCTLSYQNSAEPGVNTGGLTVNCPKEKAIQGTVVGCTLAIPAQTNSAGVTLSQSGAASYERKLNVSHNVSGMTYTTQGCPSMTNGVHTNGTLTGDSVIKGYNGFHDVGLYLSNEAVTAAPAFAFENNPETVKAELASGTTASFKFPEESSFTCSTVSGTSPSMDTSRSFLPLPITAWSGCFGSVVNLQTNGCSFGLGIKGGGAGTLGLECPAGKEVIFQKPWLPQCSVSIPAQPNVGSVTYTNIGGGATRQVTASVSVKSLNYGINSTLCNLEPGTYSDGEITMNWVLTGYLPWVQKGVWVVS